MYQLKVLCFIGLFFVVNCDELSFDLPDKEQMCFMEMMKKDVAAYLEYQVIEGGNYDVDVILSDPNRAVLYLGEKKQYDRFDFTAKVDGEYIFCFSNKFSTYTHKFIYFEFSQGDEDENEIGTGNTPMTQLETSMASIRKHNSHSTDYQTHHRLRESQTRGYAENLNERVQYWSIGQTFFIFVAGIGQVLMLKSLFKDNKPTKSST